MIRQIGGRAAIRAGTRCNKQVLGSISILSGSQRCESSCSFSSFAPRSLKSCSSLPIRFKPNCVIRCFSSGGSVFAEKLPTLGDSITEGTIISWQKNVGDWVNADDVLMVVETDKVSVDIRASKSGVLTWQAGQKGDTIKVAAEFAKIDTGAPKPAQAAAQAAAPNKEDKPTAKPASQAVPASPGAAQAAPPKVPKADTKPSVPKVPSATFVPGSRVERRVAMSRMRSTIAKRLKDAQNTYALLTTFNEIDMTNLLELRNKYKDEFAEKHGVKLGFMSCFVKAATQSLLKMPDVNAVMDGSDIVYRDYVDISIAVGTATGLVVPVVRNTESMSFAQVESAINQLGQKAKKNELTIEDMTGGTFTISNGGVYGSLMGTPIVNPPQSAILGMHGIFKRPVVVNDKIEIRSMMYVALTYDHRMLDGQQAVTFLRSIKALVEDPQRLLLDL